MHEPGTTETAARLAEAEAALADLRRRLADAEMDAQGARRLSRAQGEEIEELRARLRRAAEARAEQDEEAARLRRALREADESVVSLTRRTTEEMTSLAQRLTAGLRGEAERGEARDPALAARLAAGEQALAARESALAERDERITALELEKQDIVWRLASTEDDAASQRRRVAALEAALAEARGQAVEGAIVGELRAAVAMRDQAMLEFRRAAAAHAEEIRRLRAALAEQEALGAEMESALGGAETRLAALTQQNAALARSLGELEEIDRARRARLSEVEGLLLRARAEAAQRALPDRGDGEVEAARSAQRRAEERAAALARELDVTAARAAAASAVFDELDALELGLRVEAARLAELEAIVANTRTVTVAVSAPAYSATP